MEPFVQLALRYLQSNFHSSGTQQKQLLPSELVISLLTFYHHVLTCVAYRGPPTSAVAIAMKALFNDQFVTSLAQLLVTRYLVLESLICIIRIAVIVLILTVDSSFALYKYKRGVVSLNFSSVQVHGVY